MNIWQLQTLRNLGDTLIFGGLMGAIVGGSVLMYSKNRTPSGDVIDPKVDDELFATLQGLLEVFQSTSELRYPRPSGNWWEARKLHVLARDRFTCQYCGAQDRPLRIDHHFPHSKGGSNELKNLVTACEPCNSKKGAKTPGEWRKLYQLLCGEPYQIRHGLARR